MNKQEQDKILADLISNIDTDDELIRWIMKGKAKEIVESKLPIDSVIIDYRGFKLNCFKGYEYTVKEMIDNYYFVLTLSDQSRWHYANYLSHDTGVDLDDMYDTLADTPDSFFYMFEGN